jgi:hypothetical protein
MGGKSQVRTRQLDNWQLEAKQTSRSSLVSALVFQFQVSSRASHMTRSLPDLSFILCDLGGQDPTATTFSAVEIQFRDIIMGGIIEVDVQLTNVPGSGMSIMTYHADHDNPLGWHDQQGFRILGETLLTGNAYNSAGMQLTHWDPT